MSFRMSKLKEKAKLARLAAAPLASKVKATSGAYAAKIKDATSGDVVGKLKTEASRLSEKTLQKMGRSSHIDDPEFLQKEQRLMFTEQNISAAATHIESFIEHAKGKFQL